MHIEYYRELVTLAEDMNFHSAADQLHISQSALSKHIAELERYHGVKIFERDRSSVRLTSKGVVFVEQAAELVAKHEALMNLFALDKEDTPLAISGVLDSPVDFPLVSKAFALCREKGLEKMPTVLPCESTAPIEQAELLRKGEADCALINADPLIVEEQISGDDLAVRELFRIPIDAVVRRNNSLAAQKSLAMDDLNGQTLIRLVGPRFSTPWNSIEAQLAAAAIKVKTKLVSATSSYEYLNYDPQEAILLVQRTPTFAAPMNHSTCVRIPLDDKRLRLPLTAIYPAASANSDLTLFLDGVVEALGEAFG